MSATRTLRTDFVPAEVPLWREVLFGIDWASLHLSPVYYGVGVPRGDGSPVIVLPGFLGSDTYLMEMYHWLRRIGYQPFYSRIGRNADCPDVLTERFLETMDDVYQETGRKMHLVGHSLGGLIARSAAVQRPKQVAQVISLGSPFRDIRAHPMVLAAAGFVRNRVRSRHSQRTAIQRDCYTGSCTCEFATALRSKVPKSIGRAAIYTETDGVVDWQSCIEEEEELNTKVTGTHVGLAFNPQVYRHVAKLLASGRKPKAVRKRKAAANEDSPAP